MISALAMIFEASAAKRIISTAPIAKFGGGEDLAGRAGDGLAQLVLGPAGGADDDVHARVRRRARAFSTAWSGA